MSIKFEIFTIEMLIQIAWYLWLFSPGLQGTGARHFAWSQSSN